LPAGAFTPEHRQEKSLILPFGMTAVVTGTFYSQVLPLLD
jgi:hypothetical protein